MVVEVQCTGYRNDLEHVERKDAHVGQYAVVKTWIRDGEDDAKRTENLDERYEDARLDLQAGLVLVHVLWHTFLTRALACVSLERTLIVLAGLEGTLIGPFSCPFDCAGNGLRAATAAHVDDRLQQQHNRSFYPTDTEGPVL